MTAEQDTCQWPTQMRDKRLCGAPAELVYCGRGLCRACMDRFWQVADNSTLNKARARLGLPPMETQVAK